MFIEWNNERYSIGIDIIDNQHRELFIITNQLHEILEQEHYQKDAIKILKRLYAYTCYHFTSEEALLKEYGYKELPEHNSIHKTFQNKIKEFLEGIRTKQNYALLPLLDYLVEWILKHIQGEDTKYAEFLKRESINPEMHFSISETKRNDVLEQWQKKKLQLEIKGIDNQHRELIYILQQTNDLQHTSEARMKIYLPVIIKKLFYYTQYHFSFEEEHMAKNNFPLLKEQQELHKIFIQKIINWAEEYKKGFIGLSDEIILFLKDWTIEHILNEDKKYKEYLENRDKKKD